MSLQRPQFICFGDSITQRAFGPSGWATALAESYQRRADIINRGYSGYNTAWGVRILPYVFDGAVVTPPALVTLFFGANDAVLPQSKEGEKTQHVPLQEYEKNMVAIIDHIQTVFEPSPAICIITPPPVSEQQRIRHVFETYGVRMERSDRSNQVTGQVRAVKFRAKSKRGKQALILPRCDNLIGLVTNVKKISIADRVVAGFFSILSCLQYALKCLELAERYGLCAVNLWQEFQKVANWETGLLNDGLHLTAEGNALVGKLVEDAVNKAYPHLDAAVLSMDLPDWSELVETNPSDLEDLIRNFVENR